MIIRPLFSGSSGNCTYIEYENTSLLVDAGVSGKKIIKALESIGKCIESIDGILVTHEHTDHISSVGTLSRKYDIPVYATKGTWQSMFHGIGGIYKDLINIVANGRDFSIGNIDAVPYRIPHDASEPVCYSFYGGDTKVTVATDIGEMSEQFFLFLSGSEAIVLESNYDPSMLRNGRYPYYLKERIAGKNGHLSNDECGTTCARLAALGTRHIILGHLSAENNTPSMAYRTVEGYLLRSGIEVGRGITLEVAQREFASRELVV